MSPVNNIIYTYNVTHTAEQVVVSSEDSDSDDSEMELVETDDSSTEEIQDWSEPDTVLFPIAYSDPTVERTLFSNGSGEYLSFMKGFDHIDTHGGHLARMTRIVMLMAKESNDMFNVIKNQRLGIYVDQQRIDDSQKRMEEYQFLATKLKRKPVRSHCIFLE